MPFTRLSNLSDLLKKLLDEAPPEPVINSFFSLCHPLAVRKLRYSKHSYRVMASLGLTSVEDLATDALAPLFERDERGSLPQLRRYYCDYVRWTERSESELHAATGRMIGSALQDAMFAYHRTIDPSLARIIRTFKRWVMHNEHLALVKRGKHLYIVLKGASHGQDCRSSVDELAIGLLQRMDRMYTPQRALDATVELMREASHCAMGIKLSTLALAYRACLNALLPEVSEASEPTEPTHAMDMDALLDTVVQRSLEPLTKKYIKDGKMSPVQAGAMQQGVRIRLESALGTRHHDVDSHFEAFRKAVPDTTRSEYLATHRNIFEYLHQVSKGQLQEIATQGDFAFV